MKISTSSEKIIVYCHTEYNQAISAIEWCWTSFGSGWGEAILSEPNRIGLIDAEFKFRRMEHVQWFLLKWENLIQ